MRLSKGQDAAAQQQCVHQIIEPISYVGWTPNDDRKIEYDHEQKDHYSQPGCRQPCFYINKQAQACRHKNRTRWITPKCVPGNPERRQLGERNSGRELRMKNLLHAKKHDGHCNEKPGQQNNPLPGLRFPRFSLCCSDREGSSAKSQISQSHNPK